MIYWHMRVKGGVEFLTVSAHVCVFASVRALVRPCVLCWWACVCMSAWVGMREGEQHIVTAAPTTTESYKQTQGSWPLGGSSWQWCPRVVVDGCGTVVWGGARRRMIYWHEAD